jgi:N-acetylglucosamine-6-phosphate deacetylase
VNVRRGRDWKSGGVVELSWKEGAKEFVCVNALGRSSDDQLPFISPGFVDIQINGLAGVNFGNPEITTQDVLRAADLLASQGVTHFLPTLITDSVERMEASLERLARAAESEELGGAIVGVHLEGPYLSSLDGPRGAHPLAHCKDPDWNEFSRLQTAAKGWIRMITLAPERTGSVEFIKRAVASGVRVAIGHTAATREQILAAVDAGATLATHLGNAAHDMIQRHHNYIFDQLGEDRLLASLIVDGHHLPPHLVDIFVRVKGIDRIILVSDAVQYAGLKPGIYDGGYRQFEVRDDGFIGVVGEPRLAGSGLLLVKALENISTFLRGHDVRPWIQTVTTNPRRWLGLDPDNIHENGEASFVVWKWDDLSAKLSIQETVRSGRKVYSAL